MPVTATFLFFARDLLEIWTSNTVLSSFTAPVLGVMLVGTLLNAIIQVPFQMQFAAGKTRLAVTINLIALIFILPLTYHLTYRFGAIGAASGWAVLNLGYVIAAMPLVHRGMLKGEAGKWFMFDVARPLLACTTVAWLCSMLMPEMPAAGRLLYIACAGVAGFCAAVFALPEMRTRITLLLYVRREHGR